MLLMFKERGGGWRRGGGERKNSQWRNWPRSKAAITSWCKLERWGYSKKLLCLVVWGISSTVVSSWHNKPHSPEREIKPSVDGVQLPTWRRNWNRSGMQSSHPMQCTCTCTRTGVDAHTGWPSDSVYSWGTLQQQWRNQGRGQGLAPRCGCVQVLHCPWEECQLSDVHNILLLPMYNRSWLAVVLVVVELGLLLAGVKNALHQTTRERAREPKCVFTIQLSMPLQWRYQQTRCELHDSLSRRFHSQIVLGKNVVAFLSWTLWRPPGMCTHTCT